MGRWHSITSGIHFSRRLPSTRASRQTRRQPHDPKVEKSKSSFSRRAGRGRSRATQNTFPRLARAVVVVAAGRQARLRLTASLALPRHAFTRSRARVKGAMQNSSQQGREAPFDHIGHSLFAAPPKHACKQADTQATTRPKSGEIQEFVFATRGQRPKQSNAKHFPAPRARSSSSSSRQAG